MAVTSGAASNAVVKLNFKLTLPQGANSTTLIVAGGADADRDGTVEDNGEYQAFVRDGNVWTCSQTVPGPVSQMIFYVQATCGPHVPYELEITDGGGAKLYHYTNVSNEPVVAIRWWLP